MAKPKHNNLVAINLDKLKMTYVNMNELKIKFTILCRFNLELNFLFDFAKKKVGINLAVNGPAKFQLLYCNNGCHPKCELFVSRSVESQRIMNKK